MKMEDFKWTREPKEYCIKENQIETEEKYFSLKK